jgi:molybdate transport system regulatory protein
MPVTFARSAPTKIGDAGSAERRIRLGHRIWIEDDEAKALNLDACELLAQVAATGSLRQAALRSGISYRKALRLTGDAETCLGVRLLDRRIGGSHGGGSAPTAACRDIGQRFAAFLQEADHHLLELFEEHFAGMMWASGAHLASSQSSSGAEQPWPTELISSRFERDAEGCATSLPVGG